MATLSDHWQFYLFTLVYTNRTLDLVHTNVFYQFDLLPIDDLVVLSAHFCIMFVQYFVLHLRLEIVTFRLSLSNSFLAILLVFLVFFHLTCTVIEISDLLKIVFIELVFHVLFGYSLHLLLF